MGAPFQCSVFIDYWFAPASARFPCCQSRIEMFLSIAFIFVAVLHTFPAEVSAETCEKNSEFKPNTIILPHQSVDAGAKLIDIVSVNSIHECYSACCQVAFSCTRAVFKSKFPRKCFLFDCGSPDMCVYGQHENYDLIATVDRTGQRIAAKLDEVCNRYRVCSSDHSVCSDGRCTCQSGWIPKGSLCVPSVCKSPDLQFQCNDSSTCVAIYDRCNGIVECPDASDEDHCPTQFPSNENSTKSLSHSNDKQDVNRSEEIHNHHRSIIDYRSSPYSRISHIKPGRSEWAGGFARSQFEKSPAIRFNYDEPGNSLLSSRIAYRVMPQKHAVLRQDMDDLPRSTLYWDLNQYNRRPSVEVKRPPYMDYMVDEPDLYREREIVNTRERNFHPVVHATHERPMKPIQIDEAFPETDMKNERRVSYPFYERIVDPSVFEDAHLRTSDRKLARNGRPVTTNSKSNTHELQSTDKSKQPTGPVPSPSETATHTDVFSVLRQNQNQSHTAALILAFSLGLICCLIGLLIMEWRRRLGRRTWAMRRRPANITVSFGGRTKPTSSGSSRPQMSRSRASAASDDDGKPIYDGMVL